MLKGYHYHVTNRVSGEPSNIWHRYVYDFTFLSRFVCKTILLCYCSLYSLKLCCITMLKGYHHHVTNRFSGEPSNIWHRYVYDFTFLRRFVCKTILW